MKQITVSPSSLAIGALLTVGLFVVMGQAGPSTPAASWGPPKKSIVSVFEPNPIGIPAGGVQVVYQVPSDRWLTVTAVFAKSTPNVIGLRWSEAFGGGFSDKGFAGENPPHLGFGDTENPSINPQAAGGTIGWTFRPGSQVVLQNVSPSPASVTYYTLLGYESRD